MTGRLPGEVDGALWELVSAGLVTCDGFAGLRALLDPPPRHRPRRPGQGGGRWALLRPPRPAEAPSGSRPRSSRWPASSSPAGASSSATSSRASRSPRRGASCSPSTGRSRRAARSAAGASWPGSRASSTRCPAAVESLRAVRRAPGGRRAGGALRRRPAQPRGSGPAGREGAGDAGCARRLRGRGAGRRAYPAAGATGR